MRPRKRMVIYCAELRQAEQVGMMLEIRMPVRCLAVSRFADIENDPAAKLVVMISLSKETVDYQQQVDAYCSCPVLVWHRAQGAMVTEFLHAVGTMLAQKRGPVPTAQAYSKPAVKTIPNTEHPQRLTA